MTAAQGLTFMLPRLGFTLNGASSRTAWLRQTFSSVLHGAAGHTLIGPSLSGLTEEVANWRLAASVRRRA